MLRGDGLPVLLAAVGVVLGAGAVRLWSGLPTSPRSRPPACALPRADARRARAPRAADVAELRLAAAAVARRVRQIQRRRRPRSAPASAPSLSGARGPPRRGRPLGAGAAVRPRDADAGEVRGAVARARLQRPETSTPGTGTRRPSRAVHGDGGNRDRRGLRRSGPARSGPGMLGTVTGGIVGSAGVGGVPRIGKRARRRRGRPVLGRRRVPPALSC